MNEDVASLILRMERALAWEGIGPAEPKPGDADLVREAYRIAGHEVPKHDRDLFE